MKRMRIILLAIGCLGAAATLQAQERPAFRPMLPDSTVSRVRLQLAPQPAEFSLIWLREEVDPILRQRRDLHKLMQRRAKEQTSILRAQGMTQQQIKENTGLLKITIGNTSADNWSVFPDRALDARTIRYPLPKGISPDNRSESMKRIDRLNKMKQ